MKDTVITASRKRRELIWLAGCIVAAMGVNIYAIASYGAPWSEFFTSIGYVAVFGIVLYVATAIVRYVVYTLLRFTKKRKSISTQSHL